jgi:hypothetical protein
LTFGAAALGSLLYLVQRQRPQHRPFGRHGWRYTLAATAWLAAVTTLATYAVTLLSAGMVPSPVLAFAAPIGAGGVRAATQRGRAGEPGLLQAGESAPLSQLLTLGLPMVLDWLDQHLADLKQQQIDCWHASLRSDRALRTLVKRFHARLAERTLAGTPAIVHRLQEREELYAELYEQSLRRDPHVRRQLKAELNVAVDDILRLVYEARADALLRKAPSRRHRNQPCTPVRSGLLAFPKVGSARPATGLRPHRRSAPG